jgi:hypothetical protein
MPALVATKFTVSGLSKSMASALGTKAKRRGMTVDAYLKELIAQDIELDRAAKTKSFAELAMPFQKVLAGLSESDLDALARPRLGKVRQRTNGKKKS